MTEHDLITLWNKARWHIIISQLAPTFLLTSLVALLTFGLGEAEFTVRLGAAGILLASEYSGRWYRSQRPMKLLPSWPICAPRARRRLSAAESWRRHRGSMLSVF